MCETLIFKYDRVKYNFFDKIQEIFKLKISLEAIHTLSSTNTKIRIIICQHQQDQISVKKQT